MTTKHTTVGAFGVFSNKQIKDVNGSWLYDTWMALEELCYAEEFCIGIYSGFDLVSWALHKGLITVEEFKYLYVLLLDPSVAVDRIDWKFLSPVLARAA